MSQSLTLHLPKICVLVDSCELSPAARLGFKNPNSRINYKTLKDWSSAQREACVLRYYGGDRQQDPDQTRFFSVLDRAGYELTIARGFGQSGEEWIARRVQTSLSWDMCELALLGRYDCFVLVAGGDHYVDIVSRTRRLGVEVEIVFPDGGCGSALRTAATRFRPLPLEVVELAVRTDPGPKMNSSKETAST